jgi:hypothetical protein
MHDISTFALFTLLFGVPIFFALRGMSRELKKDWKIGWNTASYDRLMWKFLGIGSIAVAFAIWQGAWPLVILGGFVLTMAAVIAFSRRSRPAD